MTDIIETLVDEAHAELTKILEYEDPIVRDVADTVKGKLDTLLGEARTAIEAAGKAAPQTAVADTIDDAIPQNTIEGIMKVHGVSAGEAAGILQRQRDNAEVIPQ